MSLYKIFARFNATLRAHRSCCKVSSCEFSGNSGAQRHRSRGSHFWILPNDRPLIPDFLWCQVLRENCIFWMLTKWPSFRRTNFLGWRSRDAQFICVNSCSIANDPFAPPIFDFLLGLPSKAKCRKHQWSPLCILYFNTHGRMSITTWRILTVFPMTSDPTPLSLFFVYERCSRFHELLLHDWNHKSFPSEHYPVARHCQQSPFAFLSTLAFFPFRIRVTSSISTQALRFRQFNFWQYTISLMFWILNNSSVLLFVQFRDHT